MKYREPLYCLCGFVDALIPGWKKGGVNFYFPVKIYSITILVNDSENLLKYYFLLHYA